jgi:hypothetical protein
MSSSSTAAAILQRAAASAASHPARSAPQPTHRVAQEASRTLQFGTEEAAVLKLDLSDLPIPKLGGLDVDGLKPTLMQRLFGKR